MRTSGIRLPIAIVFLATLTAAVMAVPAFAHQEGPPVVPPLDIPDGSTGESVSEGIEYVAGRQGWTGGHVIARGDRLYVGSYGIGMRIYDISDPADPQLLGGYTPGLRADAVPEAWEFDGRHIATLNGTGRTPDEPTTRTDRSEFLDVTDPTNPVLLHTFVGADDGEAHVGRYAPWARLWFPAGGSGEYGDDGGLPEEDRPDQAYPHHRGLRIYSLESTISTPADDCAPDDGFDNPCAPELLFAADPVAMWEASPFRGDDEIGHEFTHAHDINLYQGLEVEGLGTRDMAVLAEGGSYTDDAGNTGSVFIIDVTDPTAPVVLDRIIHPGYDDDRDHAPIRYYHEGQLLDGDPSILMITDEDMHSGCEQGGRIYFLRLSADLTDATPLSEWHIPSDTPAPVCSVHYPTADGHHVFIGSYNAGLQVLDVSDPTEPEQVGYFVAEGTTAWGAYHQDGFVYVGDMSRGLDVFRVATQDAPDGGEQPEDGEEPDDGTPPDDSDADTEDVDAPAGRSLPATGGGAALALLAVVAGVLVRRSPRP